MFKKEIKKEIGTATQTLLTAVNELQEKLENMSPEETAAFDKALQEDPSIMKNIVKDIRKRLGWRYFFSSKNSNFCRKSKKFF